MKSFINDLDTLFDRTIYGTEYSIEAGEIFSYTIDNRKSEGYEFLSLLTVNAQNKNVMIWRWFLSSSGGVIIDFYNKANYTTTGTLYISMDWRKIL